MGSELDFSGKVVLVTGSSRGIGAGMVRALAGRGARCVINYFADSAGQNLSDAKAVASEVPGSPLLIACDVGDGQQVGQMMGTIERELGRVDVLINNAGILRDRTIKKLSEEDWQAVLRTNLDGVFHCTQAAVTSGILKSGGRIVNMASVAALGGFFGQANYAASKAGVIALTKVAARELARQQITVNAIAPGFIDTEMTQSMPPEVMQQFVGQIPLGRRGTVEDVVGAALFLCSPLAAYITGQVIHVNGGFWMG
jgi:3-oxoacyl-[acyl-carrier protein] reductase